MRKDIFDDQMSCINNFCLSDKCMWVM